MSATPNCQAENPARCRYHGLDSAVHTQVLKQKMGIAVQSYKGCKNTSEAYVAFAALRDAQNDYYSTDQGLEEIEEILLDETLSENHKHQIKAIHKTALEARISYEKSATARSAFIPSAPRPYKALPPAQQVEESSLDTHNLSIFKQGGKMSSIDYNPDKKLIVFSTPASPDESTLIGRATTIEEATRKATAWYNENFNR